MKPATVAQMKELDRRTIEELEVKGEVLMDRAGQGVASVVRRLAEASGFVAPVIHLVAGRGNNGGDAFCAARHLKDMGYAVEVWLAGLVSQVSGDAMIHLSRMKSAGIKPREMPALEDWQDAILHPYVAEIVVDGVLGTGGSGPARGPAAGAIQYINAQAEDALVVAIDVPSGLNADTGTSEGEAVLADVTATMGLPKRGMLEPCAIESVGALDVVDIGIPQELVDEVVGDTDVELIHPADLRVLFPRRKRVSHKGTYGHVLIIGGARGYSGAIVMAAKAALRSGAGLVTCLVPASLQPVVAVSVPEAMVRGAPETPAGSLSASLWSEWRNELEPFGAVLLGPGMTRNQDTLALVRYLVRECPQSMVIDADALNVMEGQPDFFSKARAPMVLTPHPGEMARLMAMETDTVQADRLGTAAKCAHRARGVVVLKGAGTLVVQEGKPAQVNLAGNPGMATGGMGDVLGGLIAGLLAQGLEAFDAARAAVFLHGRAGDLAAWRRCQASLTAGDLLEELSFAYRDITLR
jgi:ADP-dependent NAD(P)H-hydrate dehydratase / NAD(P)H-hydrate epimerase